MQPIQYAAFVEGLYDSQCLFLHFPSGKVLVNQAGKKMSVSVAFKLELVSRLAWRIYEERDR